jgi:hypothetical protein
MIDTIRKGDPLGHDFLQAVAKRLEEIHFSVRLGELDAAYLLDIGTALGDRKPETFEGYAEAIGSLIADNIRLNSVLNEIRLNDPCRCLYMAAPMDMDNRPPTVAAFALAGMTKENKGNVDEA